MAKERKKDTRTPSEVQEGCMIANWLDENLSQVLGSGYVFSDRLCMMRSSNGWQLRARLYRSAYTGELCRPKDDAAEEEDSVYLTDIPTLEALMKFVVFMNATVGT